MRLLDRIHRDEFPALRAELEQEPAHTPQPFRGAYPGVAADAIAWLRQQDAPPAPVEQVRNGMNAAVAELAALLEQPEPRTRWTDILADTHLAIGGRLGKTTVNATRELDQIQNGTLFGLHMMFAPLAEMLAEVS